MSATATYLADLLALLADVSVVLPATGHALMRDGDLWRNRAIAQADVGGLPASLASLSASDAALASLLADHEARVDNPHAVTAAQVGAYTTGESDAVLSTALFGLATEAYVDGSVNALSAVVYDHTSNFNNPHDVTARQVGLFNVPNVNATVASNITTGTLANARTTATTAATASTIVLRDASGQIDTGTAALTGGSGATAATPFRNYLMVSNAAPGFAACDTIFPGGSATTQKGIFRSGQIGVLGTNDIFMQGLPLTTAGYFYLESFGAAGTALGTGNATPVLFRPNRTTTAEFLSGGGLRLLNRLEPATLAGSGTIYVDAGALKFKGSNGTVTTLAAA